MYDDSSNTVNMTVDELLGEARRLIDEAGIRQDPQSRVASHPDLRTFRLYRTQKLIDPPEAKSGTAGVYVRKHVLQLVAIKSLQAQRLPLREIRNRLAMAGEADLEKMIGGTLDRPSPSANTNRLRGSSTEKDRRWIMVQLTDAFAVVDEAMLNSSRPSALRALGEQLTSSLLSLRR